jgi:predicted  nucleic acid-binding Zn-ribbon protein
MQTRHRIPTIFTLYMVDVFCCALGCVILLWLASARDAQRKGTAHEKTAKQLADTRLRLASSRSELTALQAARVAIEQDRDRLRGKLQTTRDERAALARRAAEAEKQHADTRRELDKAQVLAGRLRGELEEARGRDAELTAGLARKSKEYQALAEKFTANGQALQALRKDLQDREQQLRATSADVSGLTVRLKEAEARARELERRADALGAEAKGYRAQLAALESRSGFLEKDLLRRDREAEEAGSRLRDLQQARDKLERQLADRGKDLAESQRAVAALEGHAQALTAQLQTARADADRRFAGVALTGRRVVFLVDISGSMRMRDPTTEDRTKWPMVCEVLGKLMRSLPDLKQYQVIVFSDRLSYPLGRPGYWVDYDAKTSVPDTVERLKRVVPQGETNMSAAFAEAFRYRPLEMDTIYLLSDGLPNLGDGVPQVVGLTEGQKTGYLSRYVRQTLKTWWNRELPGRPRVRINTIGFFFDTPEVGAFLWALARENDGSFVGMSNP